MPSLLSMITRITLCTSAFFATRTTVVRAFSTRIVTKPSTFQSSTSRPTALSSLSQIAKQSTILRKMSSEANEAKKRVLVPIAEDSEEIETTCITDVMARFGADVVVASVKADGDLVCKMSRGIKIMADVTIEEASKEEWDLIALPGGVPGADHLRDCATLVELLKKQQDKKKLYGAMCASPAVVLASHGLVDAGATCYPAPPFRSVMKDASDDKVVVQDNVVTSQGPGTSLLFALSLGEQLYGKEAADEIAAALLVER